MDEMPKPARDTVNKSAMADKIKDTDFKFQEN